MYTNLMIQLEPVLSISLGLVSVWVEFFKIEPFGPLI